MNNKIMKSGPGKVYLDPYEWLPGYGENAVALTYQGLDLCVRIDYDNEADEATICYRELLFERVAEFRKASFPGATGPGYELTHGEGSFGSLNIYPESEIAQAWNLYWNNRFAFSHFTLCFLSENLSIEVVASKVVLGEVVYVPRTPA